MKINSTEIKNLEPIKTVALSHLGDYSKIEQAFEKLAAWAEVNKLWEALPKVIGVYHDNPMDTAVEELRSEACLENISGINPGEGMHHYTVSGGKYFVMQVEVTMAELGEAWCKVYSLINEKGYECDYESRDHYELYGKCEGDMEDANSSWLTDLCIPLK